jgi:hypothetical protein
MLCLSGEKYVLRICGSFKFANHKKVWVRKLQIPIVPHLRKARKSNKHVSLQSCGFAMGETYLQTAHLC